MFKIITLYAALTPAFGVSLYASDGNAIQKLSSEEMQDMALTMIQTKTKCPVERLSHNEMKRDFENLFGWSSSRSKESPFKAEICENCWPETPDYRDWDQVETMFAQNMCTLSAGWGPARRDWWSQTELLTLWKSIWYNWSRPCDACTANLLSARLIIPL